MGSNSRTSAHVVVQLSRGFPFLLVEPPQGNESGETIKWAPYGLGNEAGEEDVGSSSLDRETLRRFWR